MILVTGSNGHLGANLVRHLLAHRQSVRVLLRPESDNTSNDGLEVERVYGDLRDPQSLRQAVRGCERVYHTAAKVSTLEAEHQGIFQTNVLGTRSLLLAAREAGVRRVVVTGSFGATGFHPDQPSDETVPFNPFEKHLPYHFSKAALEHECLKAAVEGQEVVITVSCAILGPYDFKPSRMGRLLCDFANGRMRAYLPGGFEFVAARDIVQGHILAMEKGRPGQKYIFSTQFLTVDELMDIYERVTGRQRPWLRLPPAAMAALAQASDWILRNFFPGVPRRFTPAAVRILRMHRRADCSKAKGELGYQPTSILQAIEQAYQWFVERGQIARPRKVYAASTSERAGAQP